MNEELRMKNEEFRPRNGMRSKEILHSSFFIINLFVLYYLCHQLGFANYFFAYKHVTLHGGHAATDGGQQLYAENQRIARHYLLSEFYAVYLHEVGGIAFGLLDGVQYQQTACLCHSLYLQDAGHDWPLREVALEERFVGGDILYTDNVVGSYFDDLVNQLHGIAVR